MSGQQDTGRPATPLAAIRRAEKKLNAAQAERLEPQPSERPKPTGGSR